MISEWKQGHGSVWKRILSCLYLDLKLQLRVDGVHHLCSLHPSSTFVTLPDHLTYTHTHTHTDLCLYWLTTSAPSESRSPEKWIWTCEVKLLWPWGWPVVTFYRGHTEQSLWESSDRSSITETDRQTNRKVSSSWQRWLTSSTAASDLQVYSSVRILVISLLWDETRTKPNFLRIQNLSV